MSKGHVALLGISGVTFVVMAYGAQYYLPMGMKILRLGETMLIATMLRHSFLKKDDKNEKGCCSVFWRNLKS